MCEIVLKESLYNSSVKDLLQLEKGRMAYLLQKDQ